MPTFEIIATNCGFYQTLRVEAESASLASDMFRAYLAGPENQRDEQYEYDVQNEHQTETREDYEYGFDDDDIAEIEAAVTYPTVTMVDSGGNG